MNADNPVDVNADGDVTPGDALAVINDLSDRLNGVAQGETASTVKIYPDANGDEKVSPADILTVLNSLAQGEDIVMPTVSVAASTQTTNEGDSATFTFARTGETTSELTVGVLASGTADLDDVTIDTTENITITQTGDVARATVTFPVGVSQVVVPITAIADELTEGGEEFVVSVEAASGITVGGASQTVAIVDTSTGMESMMSDSDGIFESLLGTSLASFSGSSLSLTLGESNADIAVDAQEDGTVRVRAFDGAGTMIAQEVLDVAPRNVNLTISGSNNFLSMTDVIIANDMKINFTGSENVLVLNNTRIKDDLLLDSHSGDTTVILENYSRVDENLLVDFGSGDDLISLDQTYVGNHVIAKLGSGNDTFTLNRSTVKENLKVYGGNGNDELRMGRAQVLNDVFFYGEHGNDRLFANRSYVSDDAIVELGNGNDEVFVFGSVVKDRAKLDGESGTDTLFANTADFITDDLKTDSIERLMAASDPGEPFSSSFS
jgi:hypothetical protein